MANATKDNSTVILQSDNFVEVCMLINQTLVEIQNNQGALTTALPQFVLQLAVVLLVSRVLHLILKPLKQPHCVGYIISGILLGPSVLGKSVVWTYIFPFTSLPMMETFANLGMVYYTFLVGVEMELTPIVNSGKMALGFAISGIIVPLCIGFGLFIVTDKLGNPLTGGMFYAIALTSTNFPDVAQVLTDLKLLRTDIGQFALSASAISDFFTWIFLGSAVSLLNSYWYYAMPASIVFTLVCIFLVRPAISWIIYKTLKRSNFEEQHVWLILGWVVLFGLIADACGVHSIVGSFILGLIMPREETIKTRLVEKLDFFVSGILLPLFFLISGLRTQLGYMKNKLPVSAIVIVIVFAFAAKIISTLAVSLYYKMPFGEGMALGILMNTKGVLALIIINAGRNMKCLTNQAFTLMVIAFLIITALVEPLIIATYKPRKRLMRYKHRTLESIEGQSIQLQVLCCVRSLRDVSGMLALLEASNAKPESSLLVTAMQLVELKGRSGAMLIVHDNFKKGKNNLGRIKVESDQIMESFRAYQDRNSWVSVQSVTALSPYKTMHEDICSLAEDKLVSLIIVPFHVTTNSENGIEENKSKFPGLSRNILSNAPCSVGLLVDPGQRSMDKSRGLHVLMLYIGGPDDRDALTYAWRMAGKPEVHLTVLRFLPGKDVVKLDSEIHPEGKFKATSYDKMEKRLDDEFTYDFMFKTKDDESITYMEKAVNNGEETLEVIRSTAVDYDLYMVGRGMNVKSPLTSGLSEWNSCKELGAIGEILASSNVASHALVLVIQKYVSRGTVIPKGSVWQPLLGSHRSSFGHRSISQSGNDNYNDHHQYDHDDCGLKILLGQPK